MSIIFRNDDLAVDADIEQYKTIQAIFESHGIKELYSVVPQGNNYYTDPFKDSTDLIEERLGNRLIYENKEADQFIKDALAKGHEIALHGWKHTVISRYDQLDLIRQGKSILENHYQIKLKYFVPPFNHYNNDTIRACKELGLEILSTNRNQLEWLVRDNKPFTLDPFCWYHARRFFEGELTPDKLNQYLCNHLQSNQPKS